MRGIGVGGRETDVRLHIVTGKGGTGKTTIAAALALALASGGRRILLCEVENRQGIAGLFDVSPLPYAERRIAIGPAGGEVYALAIDPEAALLEYLDMFYRLGRAGKALDRFGVIDFATTIAPGLRDVLLTGKVYEAARRRRRDNSRIYDAVVLDAPPTGRIGRFLNVNTEVAGIAKVGPVRKQAESIMTVLKSDATRVHVVTTLEEMPVQETLDAVDDLRAIGLPIGAVIVNLVRGSDLTARQRRLAADDRLDGAEIAAALKEAGVRHDDVAVASLLALGLEHAQRLDLEEQERRRLDAAGVPVIELPHLDEGVDLGSLYDLADRLRDGVGAEPNVALRDGSPR
jgi:anion-transporting  ArsA/GET3 family ATPase